MYLKAVDVEKRRINFDVIQWLSGDDARTAYRKDNPQDRDGPPNDYYIVNQSPRTYTAGVSSNVAVNLVRLAQDGTLTSTEGR